MPDKSHCTDISVLSNSPGFLPIKWGLSKPQGPAAAWEANKNFLPWRLRSPREEMKVAVPKAKERGSRRMWKKKKKKVQRQKERDGGAEAGSSLTNSVSLSTTRWIISMGGIYFQSPGWVYWCVPVLQWLLYFTLLAVGRRRHGGIMATDVTRSKSKSCLERNAYRFWFSQLISMSDSLGWQ